MLEIGIGTGVVAGRQPGIPGRAGGERSAADPSGLTPEEQAQVRAMKQRHDEVVRHEQAHAAVGGPYAGAPTYTYQRGPDGRQYAIGGEVAIDASPVPEDPEATIRKMDIVQRAALAPAEPSPQDYRVAALAAQQRAEAIVELARLRQEALTGKGEQADTPAARRRAGGAYAAPGAASGRAAPSLSLAA